MDAREHERDLTQTQCETQTVIPIPDDTSTSSSAKKRGASCFKVACRVILFIPWLVMMCVVTAAISVIVLVLLIGSFVAVSLVQFFGHGSHYDKASQLKFLIRFWILIATGLILMSLLLLSIVPAFALSQSYYDRFLKQSINKWLCVIFGPYFLYFFDFSINVFLQLLPPIPVEHDESALNVQQAMFVIVDCIPLLLAEFSMTRLSPNFKQHKILGLHTWKWMTVLALVAIVHSLLTLLIHVSAWLLRKSIRDKLDPATMTHPESILAVEKLLPREYFVYYANGLKYSISFVLSSLLILLTWVLYFSPRLSKTPRVDNIVLFGTRTCLSILICAILWLSKTWVFLSWEATVMYTRLRDQILDSRSQLYFLGVLGRHSHDIFKLTYFGRSVKHMDFIRSKLSPKSWLSNKEGETELSPVVRKSKGYLVLRVVIIYVSYLLESTSPDMCNWTKRDEEDKDELVKNNDRVKKLSVKKRKTTKCELLMHNRTPTMHDVKQVAQYLISAKDALSDPAFVSAIVGRLTVTRASDVREELKKLIDGKTSSSSPVDENQDEPVIQSSSSAPVLWNDWEFFEQKVLKTDCSEISIQSWLEDAKNSCSFLANALSRTKKVVNSLNTAANCVIIGATFIVWLLLSGLATTGALVLIASPLLACTFIFGDTCKTLFQGIVYVFVVRPLHAGDICSVDAHKMVVKSVGVWTTTFCKIENLGTLEEVTYANSELATKVVNKHFDEFVWIDSVEFILKSPQKAHVNDLMMKIEMYFDQRPAEFVSCCHSVASQAEKDDFKIIIQLKYKVIDITALSYTKCLTRKIKVRADVCDLVRNYPYDTEFLD